MSIPIVFPGPTADLAEFYYRCKYPILFDSVSDVFSLISTQDSELPGLFTLDLFCFLSLTQYLISSASILVEWPENHHHHSCRDFPPL